MTDATHFEPNRPMIDFTILATLAAGKKRSRPEEGADMIADMLDFDATLKSRRYPGLITRGEVFAGEDHASAFPFLLTHGFQAYRKKVR